MSFRLKLVLGVIGLQALFLAAFIAGHLVWSARAAEEQVKAQAETAGAVTRRALLDAMLSYDLATMDSVLAALVDSGQVSRAEVLNPGMELLAEAEAAAPAPDESGGAGFVIHPKLLEAAPEEAEEAPPPPGGEIRFEQGALVATRPIKGPAGLVGWLRVHAPTAQADAWVDGFLRFNMAAAALSVAGLLAGAWLFAGSLSRRILLLRDGADRIAAGDAQFRLPTAGRDEISRAAAGFNAMSAALAEERARLDRRIGADHLTGAANRIGLRDHLARWRADPGAGPLALLHADLDRFKFVNDTRGHKAGDVVLAAITARLRDRTPHGGLVARIGGDEFVLVIPDRPDAALREFAEDLILAVSEPIPFGGEMLTVGASVGIARLAAGAGEAAAEAAIANADIALYASKEGGRGRATLFDERMREEMEARARTVQEVRRGVEMGDFLPVLQPQLRAADGAAVGVKALARWRHPERGLLPPAEFLEAVGDGALLARIDALVREKACAWLAGRRRARPGASDLRLGFTLTICQLRDDRTLPALMALVERHGLSPRDVALELRPHDLASGPPGEQTEMIRAMAGAGFHMELGSSGAGRSVMPLLVGGAVDRVRFDRGYVGDLDRSADKRRLVDAMIGVGAAVGVEMAAEGIETEGELRAALAAGFHLVQGYAIARPMPPDALTDWLNARDEGVDWIPGQGPRHGRQPDAADPDARRTA